MDFVIREKSSDLSSEGISFKFGQECKFRFEGWSVSIRVLQISITFMTTGLIEEDKLNTESIDYFFQEFC